MLATGRAVQALVAQVSELTTQIQQLRMPTAPLPPPVPPALLHSTTQREPRLPAPEAYNGEPDLCRAFLEKCSMFFSLQPQTFATEESKVALVLTLLSGRAAHFIPLPKLPSAKETAVTVVDHVFRIHGLPMDVVSDRGPQFVSKFWREFCRLLGASVSLSSGFHPQSNGQTERANQDLERVLRCLVTQNPASWSQHLSWVEYAHNSLPVSSTGLSPFECSLGYQPPIFPSLESEVAVPSAHAFVQRCRHTWRRARETLLRVGARTKAQADRHRSKPPVYVVGQKVWLSSKNIPPPLRL